MSRICPCGSELSFGECCEPLHKGESRAPSAESLMRSRYSAFATRNMEYLWQTTHPLKRKNFDRAANLKWAETANFERLEILQSSENKDTARVSFAAHYVQDGSNHVHSEESTFQRLAGTWYFVDGQVS